MNSDHTGHGEASSATSAGLADAERLVTVERYAVLTAPRDGAFERIAHIAATIFDAPIATVSIVDHDKVWFSGTHGLEGIEEVTTDPGLCASAVLLKGPYVVQDAAVDPRTMHHPLVRDQLKLRFYAGAPITVDGGHSLGTVNVIDRKRRRPSTRQLQLLTDLADTVADILTTRLAALQAVRAERAKQAREGAARDAADQHSSRPSRAEQPVRDRDQPQWCELGRAQACGQPATLKVADSWGDSAWGCWNHAEDALLNVPSVFLADDESRGLAEYREGRISRV